MNVRQSPYHEDLAFLARTRTNISSVPPCPGLRCNYCSMRTFPWLAWMLLVAVAVSQGLFAYLLWNRRGRASWYVKEKANDRPLSPMLASGPLPVSIMSGALSLAVVFRYGRDHLSPSPAHTLLLVIEYLAWGLVVLGAVLGLMLFFLARPQCLIPPPFRAK